MRRTSLLRIFSPSAAIAGALGLLTLAITEQSAFGQALLTHESEQALATCVATIKEKRRTGQKYLRESGLNLVVVIPSMESMLEHLRKAYAAGEIDEKSFRGFEQMVMAAPPQKRLEPSFKAVGPGFEPSTTLPRPYGTTMQDGSTLNVSERFMEKFQVTTAYDLQRVIRNASIILTDFGGGIERDNIQNHQRRLVQFYRSDASSELGLGDQSRARDILLLTASFMMLDQTFVADRGAPLPAEDHYVAALLFGSTYKLF